MFGLSIYIIGACVLGMGDKNSVGDWLDAVKRIKIGKAGEPNWRPE